MPAGDPRFDRVLGYIADMKSGRAPGHGTEGLDEEPPLREVRLALGTVSDELKARAEALEQLVSNSPVGISINGAADRKIRFVNDTMVRFMGLAREEMVGRTSVELGLVGSWEERKPLLDMMRERGFVRDFEVKVRTMHGDRHVALFINPVNYRGEACLLTHFYDITERRQLEEARRQLERDEVEALRDANRLKSEFLASMSHELRTPLNAIIGFGEVLEAGEVGPVVPKQKEFLTDIVQSGRHLLHLINDILDLSKVEAGKMEFRPESLDPGALARGVAEVLQTSLGERRVRLEVEVDESLGSVTLDPGRLKQVLYNFLSNALKFSPEGGLVRLSLVADSAATFRIQVDDAGPGIRAEDLSRLFGAFEQLAVSGRRLGGGTGLGLALTKQMVEAQGGHVGVRSSPGQGSTFFAVLPRRMQAAAAPTSALGALLIPREGGPTVLVIEDEPADATILARTLLAAGYGVQVATSGREALERLRARRFDAITLDLLLPDTYVLELLPGIRATPGHAEVPLIVVTVVREKGAVGAFEVHDVLQKPLVPEDLLDSLARARVLPATTRPVMVVDDDERAIKLAAVVLNGAGYRVAACSSGQMGLHWAEAQMPRAVVLDLQMPGMDGFQFLHRFRALPGGGEVPVIIWTVKELSHEQRAVLRASAQAVMSKNGGPTALAAELQRHLTFRMPEPVP
jgi:PAS domain S-box-containing protein